MQIYLTHCGQLQLLFGLKTGKYSAFEGLICHKDYHHVPSICGHCIASEIIILVNTDEGE